MLWVLNPTTGQFTSHHRDISDRNAPTVPLSNRLEDPQGEEAVLRKQEGYASGTAPALDSVEATWAQLVQQQLHHRLLKGILVHHIVPIIEIVFLLDGCYNLEGDESKNTDNKKETCPEDDILRPSRHPPRTMHPSPSSSAVCFCKTTVLGSLVHLQPSRTLHRRVVDGYRIRWQIDECCFSGFNLYSNDSRRIRFE